MQRDDIGMSGPGRRARRGLESKTARRRWKARYRTLDGQSRSRTFVTKADARRFLDRVGAAMQQAGGSTPAWGECS